MSSHITEKECRELRHNTLTQVNQHILKNEERMQEIDNILREIQVSVSSNNEKLKGLEDFNFAQRGKNDHVEDVLSTLMTKQLFFWIIGGICSGCIIALNFLNNNLQSQIDRREALSETLRSEIRDDLKEIRKEINNISYKLNDDSI